jgi:hypothetical protein
MLGLVGWTWNGMSKHSVPIGRPWEISSNRPPSFDRANAGGVLAHPEQDARVGRIDLDTGSVTVPDPGPGRVGMQVADGSVVLRAADELARLSR